MYGENFLWIVMRYLETVIESIEGNSDLRNDPRTELKLDAYREIRTFVGKLLNTNWNMPS